MTLRRIANYFSPCFLVVSISSHLFAREIEQATDSPSIDIRAAAFGPIKRLVSNVVGDAVFGTGDGRLVLLTVDRTVSIASSGDPVPGHEGWSIGADVGASSDYYPRDVALNARNEVAFSASLLNCMTIPPPVNSRICSSVADGLLLFSESNRRVIATSQDAAPGTGGGTFDLFMQVVINDTGSVLFTAVVRLPNGTRTFGLFLFSADRIEKIYVIGDSAPVGRNPVFTGGEHMRIPMFLDEDARAIFAAPVDFGQNNITALLRYENRTISKLLAPGDLLPDGTVLFRFGGIDGNRRGDIVFRATSSQGGGSLYFLGGDGRSFRIVGSGDRTAEGDYLGWIENTFVSLGVHINVSIVVPFKVNDAGEVLFASPFSNGNGSPVSGGGLFLFSAGQVRRVAASGDLIPDTTNSRVRFDTLSNAGGVYTNFTLTNRGMVIFSAGKDASTGLPVLLSYVDGNTYKVMMAGDPAPDTNGETFGLPEGFGFGDSGQVIFFSTVCCGKLDKGIFLARLVPPPLPIPNGDFETPGGLALPDHWQTTWTNSGNGEALQVFGPDVFEGTGALRLHVAPSGGSVFVLSDAIPVTSNSAYTISTQMRFALSSPDDGAYFWVIQFDRDGNALREDYVQNNSQDDIGSWLNKSILVRTSPDTASIRIRFGLASTTEAYLDVDSVH
jgi:hypothetical protein